MKCRAGRGAWSAFCPSWATLIGFLSQLGYVAAYAVSGVAADALGAWTGLGVGRGAAIVIQVAGGMMAVIAVGMRFMGSIRGLEGDMEPAAE